MKPPMASADLLHLWKLHLIDAALVQIRAQASALDPGREIMTRMEAAQKAADDKSRASKLLSSELTDLELKQKSIDDKVKKFEKDLYGGKVVNPREVENINKEIALLNKQRGDLDLRILELWELTPPAKVEADAAQKAVDVLKEELREFQKGVLAQKTKLEADFKSYSSQRGTAASAVPPALIARYDAIRSRHGGIGMSRISKKSTCGQCGTSLPTKVVEDVKEDKLVTCEECHRILYYSESVI